MLSFGLVFILLIPALSIPDEPNHFVRAYQISDLSLFARVNDDLGCQSESGKITKDSTKYRILMPASVAEYTSLSPEKFSLFNEFQRKLNNDNKTEVCARQTITNSPVAYIPQTLAIALLKPFDASPILMNYLARIFILITWAVIIYFAIKIIPVRKWALLAIALLPMSIQQSTSIGADVLATAPAALVMALVVRSYYENRDKFILRDLMLLMILAIIAILSKPVMVVMLLPILFYRANSKKNKVYSRVPLSANQIKIIIILLALFSFIAWSLLAKSHNASVTDIFNIAADKAQFIKDAPIDGLKLFIKQSINYLLYSGMSLGQFGSFKWFSASIPETTQYIGISVLVLMIVLGYKEKSIISKDVSGRQIELFNIATVLAAVGVVMANIFTLFVIWTPLNASAVEGVQFRYYIAALFIISVLIHLKRPLIKEYTYSSIVIVNSTIFFIVSALSLLYIL